MKNIIVKTAVKTLVVILCLFVVVFAILNFGFPQHMATFSERSGNYNLAVKYASLRYTYTGDKYDLARCVDDSILAGNDANIQKFGYQLIYLDGYDEVCEEKSSTYGIDYRQYVGGKVSVAQYNLGDFSVALQVAKDTNGTIGFASGNALMSLSLKVAEKSDSQNAQLLLAELEKITPNGDEQAQLLSAVEARLSALL